MLEIIESILSIGVHLVNMALKQRFIYEKL